MHITTKLIIFLRNKLSLLVISIPIALLINPAKGQSASSKPLIDLQITNQNLNEVIGILKSQSSYDFFYDKEAAKKVAVHRLVFKKITIEEALRRMHKELPLEYEVLRNEVSIRIESPEKFNLRKSQQKPGKLSGRIMDDKGETLPGASIKILSTNTSFQSATDGTYQQSLEPGTYAIEVSFMGYQTKRITDVTIKAGQNTPLDILLKADSKSLNAVVVTASYKKASIEGLYARQKNNAALSDGITAEQISRTPDNNTAQVLKRVSGLQISQNKYVVIRGLSDRYNNLMLNGAPLPSSEPNRRDFAFDMVPSALVDNIVVNKTATPDLTGEFTGGLVQITTKDIPDENFTQVTLGTGYNSRATGKDFIGLGRSKYAYLGFGDSHYDRPTGMTFKQYIEMIPQIRDPKNTEQRKQAASFLSTLPNNWAMRKYTALPAQNYQFSLGRSIHLKENTLGIIAALTYRNEQEADQNDRYQATVNDYTGTDYTFTTTLGGSLGLAYRFGKNKITLKNTYNRKLSDLLYKFEGTDLANNGFMVSDYSNVVIINQLFQSVLSGEHSLGKRGIKFDWQASMADLNRDQPFTKIMDRRRAPTGPEDLYDPVFTDLQASLGSLYYSKLKEKLYTWAANFQVPFNLLNLNQSFKLGYQGKYRKADFGADIFRIRYLTQASGGTVDYSGMAYYDIYNSTNFANSGLYLYPISGGGKDVSSEGSGLGYNGFQRLNAFYGMFDLKLTPKLRLITGLRAEKNDQNVANMNPNTGKEELISLKKTDWLPSANFIYALNEKMNVRAAWYKTVARPDLRELSSFEYFDPVLMRGIFGSSLKSTSIENADVRYEFYPSPGEIISISGFYKKFKNPIELQLLGTSGQPSYKYTNLASAKDLGLEIDFRKSLDFISTDAGFLKNTFVSGSLTLLDANVELEPSKDLKGDSYKRDRPLYGQSPYIINAGINYTGKQFGLNVLYNRYGKRIVFASAGISYDEYEKPRNLVDLQVNYKFLKQQRAEVKFNISDLLNAETIIYRNQYPKGNPRFKEGEPSVQDVPGASYQLAEGQADPKGTSYNPGYDLVAGRIRNGTTYSLSFSYRF
ncbi:TonB-dependent receptor [Pedobacter sp.]|jgi:outer membrane receptor protein involved in Fe transport|uniref:TonB-dependent receptor n=1 Tax=Pedobacter sp. TaxID=1411316 RepID=UPI002C22AF37|nr:TonB-dependent receptor [Pedobacter sp.]HWW39373.1 TonB-dependent receptor [Pedobacter sp.]